MTDIIEEAINEILFLTRCHPYFTQLLCQEVFNQQLSAEGEKANHVTLQTSNIS